MATSDLSLVSTSLQALLTANIGRLAGNGAPTVAVSLGYPEDQVNADRTINLHLYHIAEDQFHKNLPGPGTDPNSVATTPMSLSLFYLMTAHHKTAPKRAETEQQIMGHALKTLHDFAFVDPDTSVADVAGTVTKVLQPGLDDADTRLEIVLRPLTPEDALAYWATEQQQPVRLAAYYEVRLVQLEPEPAKSAANMVLTVGQWVGLKADVALTASRSSLRFARPAGLGGSLPDEIELSPGRPFLDHPAVDAAFPDSNHFWLLGTGLAAGIRRRLVVRHDSWRALGVPGGEIALPEAVQPGGVTDVWGVAFDSQRIDVRLAGRIAYTDADGNPATLDILPGTYRARADVVIGEQAVGTQVRELVRRSNEVLFQIAPRLGTADAPVLIPGPPDRHRITFHVSPRFDLTAAGLDLAFILDGEAYQRVPSFDPVPEKNDGLFRATMHTIVAQPLFDVAKKGLHTVRLSVNGVDSQPFWLETGP
ncbi:MAG: DUF4255 domain-containing protein [Alphaproteobacteria bacterium]|nr:DUF4255 domain-containing protein [Alphaproteobacteria bacterium]MBV9900276.1 DUF4255 domain-containing protein [Alphaproteobacteria bacterium]